LGVTVRALRVYERHGLLRPGRTQAGWRVYGPEEVTRLHQVLALKRLGLPLARIADLIAGRDVDLDKVLALQEADLVQRKVRVDRALQLVRRARGKLARGETLPTDDLVELTKETAMAEFKSSPEFEALANKHVDAERVRQLHARPWTEEDQRRASEEWAALIAEAERLAAEGDPSSPEAFDLARRWKMQVEQFTMGDPQLTEQVGKLYSEAASQGMQMPFSQEVWRFVSEAQKRLAEASQSGR
jgi:DNA-binding transcriptional MerR regulator